MMRFLIATYMPCYESQWDIFFLNIFQNSIQPFGHEIDFFLILLCINDFELKQQKKDLEKIQCFVPKFLLN